MLGFGLGVWLVGGYFVCSWVWEVIGCVGWVGLCIIECIRYSYDLNEIVMGYIFCVGYVFLCVRSEW